MLKAHVTKFAFVLAAVALFAFALTHAPAARAANPAENYVAQNINVGLSILNDSSLSQTQRRDKFRAFILGLTDMQRIAMFTLGRYRRGVPEADVNNFVSAFTDYANAVYEEHLIKYKGQTMKVVGSSERSPTDYVVNVEVPATQGGQPISAAFRVLTEGAKPVVVDVQVEGVWLAITQRDQFAGYLQQNGGNVKLLSAYLRQQADAIETGRASSTVSQ
ncbi:MAG: ABC transporter substrate-binding protein [Alphaproteobacteria bacterium]